MKILILPNTTIEKNTNTNTYEEHVKTILSQNNPLFSETKNINQVTIVPHNEQKYYGKVEPSLQSDGTLVYNLIYTDRILNWYADPSCKKYVYAKSIIFHELYHIEEMNYTSQFIPAILIVKTIFENTKEYLLHIAIQQWSEYYAYRNSAMIYPRTFDMKPFFNKTQIDLSICAESGQKYSEVNMPISFMKNIDNCISHLVIEIAHYHTAKTTSYIDNITKYQEQFSNECRYAMFLENLFVEKWNEFKYKLSEEWYLELGKSLFTIYEYYGLSFSDDTLSDNFIYNFKK